jgi:hypothetical protein
VELGHLPNHLGAYALTFAGFYNGEEEEDQAKKKQLNANINQHNGFHHSTPVVDDMMDFLNCSEPTNIIQCYTIHATHNRLISVRLFPNAESA